VSCGQNAACLSAKVLAMGNLGDFKHPGRVVVIGSRLFDLIGVSVVSLAVLLSAIQTRSSAAVIGFSVATLLMRASILLGYPGQGGASAPLG
jgi:hypothetical protein